MNITTETTRKIDGNQSAGDVSPLPALTVIRPSNGWVDLGLRDLWEFRDLLYFLLWRDIKGRYRQMALGPLWILIQPLASMLIYTLVFSVIAKLPSDGYPYPVFIYSALLPWTFFAGAASRASGSLVSNAHLISKVYFPRFVAPIVSTLSGLVDFGISFVILLVIALFYGIVPTFRVLALPVFLLLAIATGLAVGLWLAALNVRFRDVTYLVSYFLQAWMYATPVVYSSSVIPEQWRFIYLLNPMTFVVEGFRWAVLNTGEAFGLSALISACFVLVFLVAGAYYFRRAECTIVDVV